MFTRLGLVLVLVSGICRSADAQQAGLLRPGDGVRLYAPTLTANQYTSLSGAVTRIGPTDLFIATPTGAERPIPLSAIVELRRAAGSRREIVRGIETGVGVGGIVALVLHKSDGLGGQSDNQRELIITAALGAVGGIVGSRIKTTHWEVLSLSTVRPEPLPGTFVRIVSPRLAKGTPVSGTVRSWSADSVGFQPENDPALLVFPIGELNSVEWPVTRGRQATRGVLIGGGIGAVVGAIAGAATPEASCSFLCFSSGEMALIGGLGGLMVGGVVGGVVGTLTHWTKWEHGEPGGKRISVAPLISPHGGGVAMSLSF
jgi:hypothetical protein